MRLFLLAAVLFVSSCGSQSSKPSVPTPKVISEHKAGPLDVLSDSVINKFLALNEALIRWDSTKVLPLSTTLIQLMDDLKAGLSKDSTAAIQQLDRSRNEIQRLKRAKRLEDKRLAYTSSNEAFFEFLKLNHYSGSTVYFQVCPMAFNDTGLGYWLSRTKDIRNPYLGLHHPRYGKSMLDCGHNKDVLNGTLKEEE